MNRNIVIALSALVGCSTLASWDERCEFEHCTVEAALEAIYACRESYEDLLSIDLPKQVEMAHVDIFEDGYVLALTRGESPRLGTKDPNYHPYVVCVLTTDYVMHELLHSHGSKFFEEGFKHADYDPVASIGRRPIMELVFLKAGDEFEFLETRPIPDDW